MFDMLTSPYTHPLKKLIWMRLKAGARAVWDTISGNPVSFTAKAAPLRQLKVAFSPVQSGTGDPSPDNVRPISGWSSLTVEQRGKNLIDPSKRDSTSPTLSRWYYADGFLLKAGQDYTLSCDTAGATLYINNKATDDNIKYGATVKYTPTEDILVYFRAYASGGASGINLQLELGDEATAYTPYNPSSRSISISIGETVYSGTLDVLTGVVTVDWVSRRITSMNRNNGHFFYIGSGSWEHRPLAKLTTTGGLLCDRRPTIAQPSSGSTAIDGCYTDSSRAFNIRTLESYATASEMMTAMGGEVNICYKTDPFTIQLTPQEVESLAGGNVMWTDGDSLTVEYRSN